MKIGLVFCTKDRVDLTVRSLRSIESSSPEARFDLLWLDGSDSIEGQRLPCEYQPRGFRIIETLGDVRGGPDRAIRLGLKRLLDLGYDYIGLLENDIELESDWFEATMDLFDKGAKMGLDVGAVTARSFESRTLAVREGMALLWNAGAAMVIFKRSATKIVLKHYRGRKAVECAAFYAELFDVDLSDRWELWRGKKNRPLGTDWGHALELYRFGMCTLGCAPSRAKTLILMRKHSNKRASWTNCPPREIARKQKGYSPWRRL